MQQLRSGETLTLFGSTSFGSANPYLTLTLDDWEYRGGTTRIEAGDTRLTALRPRRLSLVGPRDSVSLQGLSGVWRREGRMVSLTVGTNRFPIRLPGRDEIARSMVADAEILERAGRNHFGAGLTVFESAAYLDPSIRSETDAVVNGSVYREIRPRTHLFGRAWLGASEGGFGAKAGISARRQNGEYAASVYHFSEELPFFYPVLRPGESGVDLNGYYRLSEFSSISGGVNYVDEDPFEGRSAIASRLNYSRNFGFDRPSVRVSWSYNELLEEDLDRSTDIASFGNRFSVSLSRRSLTDYYEAQVAWVDNDRGERAQLSGSLGRQRDEDSRFDLYGLLQSQGDDLGLVSELTFEQRWRGPWYYSYGIGLSLIETDETKGDGVVSLGMTRRDISRGWFGGLSVTIPFDIGLPEAGRFRETVRLTAGVRYDWRDISQLRSFFAPVFFRGDYGVVRGAVISNEGPVQGAIVSAGYSTAVTDSEGRYEISRVPTGPATVTLDLFSVDPNLTPQDETVIQVEVPPAGSVTVDFRLRRAVLFLGSVVRCEAEGDGVVPIREAAIALIGEGGAYQITTDSNGAFAREDIQPGRYQLIVNPSDEIAADEAVTMDVDLTQDLIGLVIRIGCDGE